MNMREKSYFVTGGASGIGLATAVLLGEAGANVTIADINADLGEAAVAAVVKAGGNAQFVAVDVAYEEHVSRGVAAAVSKFGVLHGACNAAGRQSCSKLPHEMTISDWDRVNDINMKGLFLCNKHEIIALLAGGGGSIVNISSSGAVAGFPNGSEYCASKAGVLGFTRAAAIDYATKGIRINAILPGGTLTPMLKAAMETDPGLEPALAVVYPMKRFAQPHEIAYAVRWLLSDESTFVTGASYPVDGGHTAI